MAGIILPYRGIVPTIAPSAFIAPTATIIGDVEIAADAGIWFGCIIRGVKANQRIAFGQNHLSKLHAFRIGHRHERACEEAWSAGLCGGAMVANAANQAVAKNPSLESLECRQMIHILRPSRRSVTGHGSGNGAARCQLRR